MKKNFILIASALLLSGSAFAAEPTLNWYGFIRNYCVYDTHESTAGTENLYYYMPTDKEESIPSLNFVALTSRLGLDVKGYEVEGYKVGAKIEADFYSENGTTAVLRMRQAYMSMSKDNRSWKVGQAWHPMAADLPDVFSLESGAPFGPFSRSPLAQLDYKLSDKLTATIAGIWQMQYTSTGPDGASSKYIKSACTPELYLGISHKNGGNLYRIGADVLSIKPYGKTRLTTLNLFAYGQETFGDFVVKEKFTYAQDGSHMNMVGGYGICGGESFDDLKFSATRNLSGWMTVAYKKNKKVTPALFLGYVKPLGTSEEIVKPLGLDVCFWGKNNAAKLAQLYRIQPEVVYNLGKVQFGLEYMFTAATYAKKLDAHYLPVEGDEAGLHTISNNRIQMMVKYTF